VFAVQYDQAMHINWVGKVGLGWGGMIIGGFDSLLDDIIILIANHATGKVFY